jgi:gluconate 2-dehydrogenase gamma chain
VERRDLLHALSAAAAFSILPRDAEAAWARVREGWWPAGGLTEQQLALIGEIADIIIPRTEAPGATDVRVPAFIDVIVSEQYSDADRDAFVTGLAGLSASEAAIDAIEKAADRRAEPQRTYWRLKGLVIHGYFTSERVMRDVLKVEIMPGRFDGAAPMPVRTGRPHE